MSAIEPGVEKNQSRGALSDVRVLDLSRVLAGPFCSQVLADHGADVIKVEPPAGDESRDWGPPFKEDGTSAYFTGVNRNKRGIALDLAQPEARAVVLRLLEDTDVLIENFRIGTMEKWGLGYEDALRCRFPRLIYCRITGFGADGPLGGFPGYDNMLQAWSGLMSVTGSTESGPLRVGVSVVDLTVAMNAVAGILLALHHRHSSGRGQFVEIALYDSGIMLLHPHAPNWFMSGKNPQLTGNGNPNISPSGLVKTRGKSMLVGAGNERQFRILCEQIGRPDLCSDARFRTNADRLANRAELMHALEDALANVDGEEMAIRLMRAGVPAGAILSISEVLTHPHTYHRQMVAELGDYRETGIPIKLSDSPGSVRSVPPRFGEHSHAVLRDAGLSDDEISRLIAAECVPEKRKK
jgi:crotonobetainyl-CoA:carnitine CoA-transferase CaiB-like acyl-CoA transferase